MKLRVKTVFTDRETEIKDFGDDLIGAMAYQGKMVKRAKSAKGENIISTELLTK